MQLCQVSPECKETRHFSHVHVVVICTPVHLSAGTPQLHRGAELSVFVDAKLRGALLKDTSRTLDLPMVEVLCSGVSAAHSSASFETASKTCCLLISAPLSASMTAKSISADTYSRTTDSKHTSSSSSNLQQLNPSVPRASLTCFVGQYPSGLSAQPRNQFELLLCI